jgi:hypothetical protein
LEDCHALTKRIDTRPRISKLQLEAPIPDDANLLELEDQAANYIREAKRREPAENKELVSIVVDAVPRNYFEHAIRKQQQRARRTHKP